MTDDELREAVALYLEDQALNRRKKKFEGRLSDLHVKLGKAKAVRLGPNLNSSR